MTSLDFPRSPSDGQTYTDQNGKWTWHATPGAWGYEGYQVASIDAFYDPDNVGSYIVFNGELMISWGEIPADSNTINPITYPRAYAYRPDVLLTGIVPATGPLGNKRIEDNTFSLVTEIGLEGAIGSYLTAGMANYPSLSWSRSTSPPATPWSDCGS